MPSAEGVTITTEQGETQFIACVPGKTHDGYHTFDELYDHRCVLFAALLKLVQGYAWIDCFKSKKHHDNSEWEGWFIAGVMNTDRPQFRNVLQITYHLPLSMWDLVEAPEYEKAPEWDGHTSNDVIDRLKQLIAAI